MSRGRSVQMVLLAVLGSVCCALPAHAAPLDGVTPFLSAQYFSWREFSGGSRLLKEEGPLFAGGVLGEFAIPRHAPSALALRGKVEIFGGVVDYHGETQAPNPVPVKTEVSYLGTRQELDLGYRYSSDTWYLEPFSGVGYRWWLRGLQDATSSAGSQVSGYTEYWQTAYLRTGGRSLCRVGLETSLFLEGGAKYPFYTGNSVNFAGAGRITFRPVGEWSGFAETGINYRRLRLALSYEGFRFSSSPLVQVGTKDYFQPDSASDIFGLHLGWTF